MHAGRPGAAAGPGRLGLQGRPPGGDDRRGRPGRAVRERARCSAARGCCGSGASRTAARRASGRLEVSSSASTVAPGRDAAVTVRGYDDNGRGVPVAGATVRLGSAVGGDRRERAWRRSTAPARRAGAADGRARGHGAVVAADGARPMKRLLLAPRPAARAARRLRPRLRRLAAAAAAAAELTVSRNFGAEELGHSERKTIPGGETVMRQLQRKFTVETRYGGGFVQEIDGVAGGRRSGRPVDWFYLRERHRGGLRRGVAAALARRPRVVGPPRLGRARCASRRSSARSRSRSPRRRRARRSRSGSTARSDARRECREVRERLEDEGAQVGGSGTLGTRAGPEVLRLLVGRWSEVRVDPTAAAARAGAEGLGRVRAARPRTGSSFELLDPRGQAGAHARPGRRAGRGDALPRPAADVGGDRHRRRGRGLCGRRAGRGAAEGPLRGRARERARGAGPAAGGGGQDT